MLKKHTHTKSWQFSHMSFFFVQLSVFNYCKINWIVCCWWFFFYSIRKCLYDTFVCVNFNISVNYITHTRTWSKFKMFQRNWNKHIKCNKFNNSNSKRKKSKNITPFHKVNKKTIHALCTWKRKTYEFIAYINKMCLIYSIRFFLLATVATNKIGFVLLNVYCTIFCLATSSAFLAFYTESI